MSKNISILNHQIKYQGQILDSDVTEAIQDVSNDEMVYGIKLKLQEVTTEKNGKYWASGISVVAHMKNPKIPAIHFNTRFIVTSKEWFGG